MKKSTMVLLIILVLIVGFYVINEKNNKILKEESIKLNEYAEKVKSKINKDDYLDNKLVDKNWLANNNLIDLFCEEVYFDGNDILLHRCSLDGKQLSYYNQIYDKETKEYKKIYNKIKNLKFENETGKLLKEIVVEDKDIKIDECINSKCEEGTPLMIQVSPEKKYKFYVVKDDSKEVTLILDHNIRNEVLWAESDNLSGPKTLIKNLKKATDSWINIGRRKYDFNYKNNDIISSISRSSIPSKDDIKESDFYKDNLEKVKGYWLMEASEKKSFNAYAVTKDGVKSVDITTSNYGYRPIIKINR